MEVNHERLLELCNSLYIDLHFNLNKIVDRLQWLSHDYYDKSLN